MAITQATSRSAFTAVPRLIPVDGVDGAAATVEAGTVTTIPYGEPATVVNVGSPGAAVFDFELPAGPGALADTVETVFSSPNIYNRSMQEELETLGAYPLARFGIVDSGSIDQLAKLNLAIAEGVPLYANPGTVLVSGQINLQTGTTIKGAGRTRSTFKLADGSNSSLFRGSSTADVTLSDFLADGNKAGQTDGISARGFYFTGSPSVRTQLTNLELIDCQDHGYFFSGCGDDSIIAYCIARRVGSEEHLAAGGPGGTGFVSGMATTRWIACTADDCYLNGFKSNGTHISPVVYGVSGGAFETEAGGEDNTITYNNVFVIGGNGFRIAGTNNIIRISNAFLRDIRGSAVTAFSEVNELHIDNFTARNCGTAGAPRSSVRGNDAISLLDFNTATPGNAFLSNITVQDDQGVPTTEYGIYADGWSDVYISGNNKFQDTLTLGSMYFTSLTTNVNIKGNNIGWSGQYRDETATTVTGTTSRTDLKSTTLIRPELPIGLKTEIFTRGSVSGTTGTKTLDWNLNGTRATAVLSWTAGQTGVFMAKAALTRIGATSVLVEFECGKDGGTATKTVTTFTISAGTDLVFKLEGTLGDAADSISETFRTVQSSC